MARATGPIGRIEPVPDDALKPHPARRSKSGGAVHFDLIVPDLLEASGRPVGWPTQAQFYAGDRRQRASTAQRSQQARKNQARQNGHAGLEVGHERRSGCANAGRLAGLARTAALIALPSQFGRTTVCRYGSVW
jgi:hypothetical protein